MKHPLNFYIALIPMLLVAMPIIGHAEERVPKTTQEALKQFQAIDVELNKVYQQCIASKSLGVQTISALQHTQRLWIEYRDLNAVAYTGKGSRMVMSDNYYFFARTLLTRSRIQELKTLFLSHESREAISR